MVVDDGGIDEMAYRERGRERRNRDGGRMRQREMRKDGKAKGIKTWTGILD